MKPFLTNITTIAGCILLSTFALQGKAQTKPSVDSMINKGNTTVKNTANSLVDTKNTLVDTKNMLSGFLPAKKPKDTVYVVISNIKYGNADLTALKADIAKKTKNEVPSMLKEGIVIMKAVGKKEASALYDMLASDLQQKFEPQDMEGSKLMLQYKP